MRSNPSAVRDGPPRHGAGRDTLAQARENSLSAYEPGTIVVKTSERGCTSFSATARPVATRSASAGPARPGPAQHVNGNYLKPAWSPPAEVRADKPHLPADSGRSSSNPMGVAADDAERRRRVCHPRHHNPSSIGGYVSYGCIRMHNSDIMDLYQRVAVAPRSWSRARAGWMGGVSVASDRLREFRDSGHGRLAMFVLAVVFPRDRPRMRPRSRRDDQKVWSVCAVAAFAATTASPPGHCAEHRWPACWRQRKRRRGFIRPAS